MVSLLENLFRWISKSWRWLVPLVLLISVVGGAIVVFGAMALLKSNDAYEEALARARASTEVRQALGGDVEAGMFFTGSFSSSAGGGGRASFQIPLSGPHGEGTLIVEAYREVGADEWKFRTLYVHIDQEGDSNRINLLTSQVDPSRRQYDWLRRQ